MKRSTLIHLAVVGTVLLVSIGGYFFLYHTVIGAKEAAQVRIEAVAQKDAAHTRIRATKNELSSLVEEEASLQAHFVQTKDIVSFLELLEGTGRTFGTTVTVVSVIDAAAENRVTLSLSIAGSFDGVVRTLGAIEYGEYAIVTKDVSLTMTEPGVWTATGRFLAITAKTP